MLNILTNVDDVSFFQNFFFTAIYARKLTYAVDVVARGKTKTILTVKHFYSKNRIATTGVNYRNCPRIIFLFVVLSFFEHFNCCSEKKKTKPTPGRTVRRTVSTDRRC